MAPDLGRLLRPKQIAVVGGGAWCRSVIKQCERIGFSGDLWSVHPTKSEFCGRTTFRSVRDLPSSPDACFIGVNRQSTIGVVSALADMQAGGAVCFASGFQESDRETGDGAALECQLLQAAGSMPILGPNCYGFINYLDRKILWPDQHGGLPVDSGVAILTQSSNIAINLTMQTRSLPIAYMISTGNQVQTAMADLAMAVLNDDRVTTLGLHIEGVGNIRKLEALANQARALGKSIVVLKTGRSVQAQAGAVSHTASVAGSEAGARALFARLGWIAVDTLAVFLDTLKILHIAGPLQSRRIASMSCSGGEAGLMADLCVDHGLECPPLDDTQIDTLRGILGVHVSLANPLDYHTDIWADARAMQDVFATMMHPSVALGVVVADFPRTDRCSRHDWNAVIDAAIRIGTDRKTPLAILASLPETMPEDVAIMLAQNGVVPLCDIHTALAAIAAAATPQTRDHSAEPVLLPAALGQTQVLPEVDAKDMLQLFGLQTPRAKLVCAASDAARTASEIGFPVALKVQGLAHKSESGGVVLGLCNTDEVETVANRLPDGDILVEEMIDDTVVELLVGITMDEAHGFVLTLAAGGIYTELLDDCASALIPVAAIDITHMLRQLKIGPRLNGYRGQPGVNMTATIDAVLAVQDFAIQHQARLAEIEINPLICGTDRVVAVDALIRMEP